MEVNDFDGFEFMGMLGENRLYSKIRVTLSKEWEFRSSKNVARG